MISVRRIVYATIVVFSMLLAAFAMLFILRASFDMTYYINSSSSEFPWIRSYEIFTLITIAVCSTFGYSRSINTDEPLQDAGSTDGHAAQQASLIPPPSFWKFTDWVTAQLELGMRSLRFRRGLVHLFSSVNLLLISLTSIAVATDSHLHQIVLLASIYLLFCIFNLIVVFSNTTEVTELHLAFRWLREENVISLAVFVLLAILAALVEQLHHRDILPSATSKSSIAGLIAGVSFFHCAAGTIKYFYATFAEARERTCWVLARHQPTIDAVPICSIQSFAKKDFHFIILLILICALVVVIPIVEIPPF